MLDLLLGCCYLFTVLNSGPLLAVVRRELSERLLSSHLISSTCKYMVEISPFVRQGVTFMHCSPKVTCRPIGRIGLCALS